MSHDLCQIVHDALDRLDCSPRGPVWKFSALCPFHEDRDPSLSVCEGVDGRALVLCRAGCRTEDVVGAMALSWADLFPNGHRHAPKGRQPRVKTERPVISILIALYAIGVGYRRTTRRRACSSRTGARAASTATSGFTTTATACG